MHQARPEKNGWHANDVDFTLALPWAIVKSNNAHWTHLSEKGRFHNLSNCSSSRSDSKKFSPTIDLYRQKSYNCSLQIYVVLRFLSQCCES